MAEVILDCCWGFPERGKDLACARRCQVSAINTKFARQQITSCAPPFLYLPYLDQGRWRRVWLRRAFFIEIIRFQTGKAGVGLHVVQAGACWLIWSNYLNEKGPPEASKAFASAFQLPIFSGFRTMQQQRLAVEQQF
ncbi:hypothetical protein [Pontibacter beigongshangensis]|uniref:hypothetical protein n=1 Tax=Pontibacter beigongshangensis TaxID=2574733 RepID=UPI00164F9FF6|nr:hypothetical protein [Pontibacter beigongshangensis]